MEAIIKELNKINKTHKNAIINYQIDPKTNTIIIHTKTRDGRTAKRNIHLAELYREPYPLKALNAVVNEMLKG